LLEKISFHEKSKMKDEEKTKEQLTSELLELRQRVT